MATPKKPKPHLKRGRPLEYDPNFHPEDFIKLSKQGNCIVQMAGIWNLHTDTIYDWKNKYPEFSVAYKKGKVFLERWYIDLGKSAMLGKAKFRGKNYNFNLGAYVWMTKNVLKWSDRMQNNDKIVTTERPLKDVSDEELESYDV